jgi:hypothetical protein
MEQQKPLEFEQQWYGNDGKWHLHDSPAAEA